MNLHVVKSDSWDVLIEPKQSILQLNIKEVWRYRDLIVLLVKRDFVAQYKQTILGPLWHLIQPILTALMFLFIFGNIAKLPTDGITPILFYLSGITLWNYFSVTLTATSSTFITNSSIFGKVYFPRIIMPIAVVFSNLIRLGIQLILLISAIFFFYLRGVPFVFSYSILILPVLLILLAGIGLGLGIIISSITTKYRDLTVLMGFAVQLGMYATPIIYPLSYIRHFSYAWIVEYNPLTPIIEAFRHALFQSGNFQYQSLLYSILFMIFILVVGIIAFNKVEKTFMDTV